jgi:Fe-S-cluster containining protein
VSRNAFAVEIAQIRRYLQLLPQGKRNQIASRIENEDILGGERCIFLDDSGQCDVYPVRPVICRTHGPAVRMPEQNLAWCELNFSGLTEEQVSQLVPAQAILDVELINRILALINHKYVEAYGGPARLPLTALFNQDTDE